MAAHLAGQVLQLPISMYCICCVSEAALYVQVRNKKAKLGKSLSKNMNKMTESAEQTVRIRRKGFKLPSLLSGSRTTG